ncbi:hypothetical protein B0J17DRAFT_578012, partial [Rhizoctonia solani]
WFSTPALDKNTLSKLAAIQLFTESKDQGWITNPWSASYRWFDLVVLSSPNDTKPKIVDGLELAWRSHSNRVGVDEFEVLDGFVFDSTHDLFGLLEEGNAIGVQVSCRFAGWENKANDGCLKLRFSATSNLHFSYLSSYTSDEYPKRN